MSRVRKLLAGLHDVRGAAAAFPDALLLLDACGRLRWCNPAADRLLGLAWPQHRGVRVAEHFADTEVGAWLRDGTNDPDDIAAPTAAGMRLQLTAIPYGERGRLLLARDVSHVSRLEQMRRDFVANVSHELRTPLTVIHGYLELLEPDEVPALAPVLAEMRLQSQRMREIVEDLLTVSRLEMERQLPEEWVNMSAMLRVMRREAEALSQGRHRVVLEDEAGLDLLGSHRDLHSAFSNLVSNAVRYTPEGGVITIGWKQTPKGATYSVADTGYGIPAEHLSRLTERFYRVSSSRSRITGGTGLGLSIVKHVLNLHAARLDIASELGKGSRFSATFSAARLRKTEHP